MKVAIITANFGGYEILKPAMPQDGCDVEFVCVTDNFHQPDNGWRLVLENGNASDANMLGKPPKCTPWMYTDADTSIWIDASFRIKSRDMASELMARAHPIAQFLHPDRDCVYDEAATSATLERYKSLPIVAQLASYAGEHPRHWGLWAAGVIARKHTTEVKAMGRAWLDECHHWGIQDQISQAPCLNWYGLRPVSLPNSLYQNPWLSFEPSSRHQEARR